jgi:glycosyltransferase involved in cell wall biosynthesis
MVFAGSDEGLPNALIEAKSSGLPVIAFKHHGVTDVVRDSVDGYLVESDDIRSFASRVLYLYRHQSVLTEFAEEVRTDCTNRFSLDRIARVYVSHVYGTRSS